MLSEGFLRVLGPALVIMMMIIFKKFKAIKDKKLMIKNRCKSLNK
jgi:hypothetical protein